MTRVRSLKLVLRLQSDCCHLRGSELQIALMTRTCSIKRVWWRRSDRYHFELQIYLMKRVAPFKLLWPSIKIIEKNQDLQLNRPDSEMLKAANKQLKIDFYRTMASATQRNHWIMSANRSPREFNSWTVTSTIQCRYTC